MLTRVSRRLTYVAALSASAMAVALLLVAAIARLNSRLPARDLAPIGFDLWALAFLLLGIPVIAGLLVLKAIRLDIGPTDVFRLSVAWLFALLWVARLEPAHQPISVRPHLSDWGLFELAIIGFWSAAIFLMSRRRRIGRAPGWAAAVATMAAGTLCLIAVAAFAEPPRRRDDPVRSVAARFPARAMQTSAPRRVLVVGIDGLEWRTLDWMLAHGRMPTVARLLQNGRFYQQDNAALTYSAEIWTGLWTGRPTRENDVGDFAKWQFLGARHPIVFLPRFGMHGLWFFDEVLRRTDDSPLWRDETTSTTDILTPPVWSIASAAGKRVGVFSPVPQNVVAEEIDGFYAVAGDDEMEITSGRGPAARTQALPIDPRAITGEFGADHEAARIVAELLERARPDLGIFYTHFVDSTQHETWDYRLKGRYFGGDPMIGLDDRFDATAIRRAYDEADWMIARLMAGFGDPATVVVVSDHGWRYDDYEHFRSPFGVLIVSPSPQTGYGAVADLRSVTPTILSLLDVPLDPTLGEPAAPFEARRVSTPYSGVVRRRFVQPEMRDTMRLERLRSLGYIEGRPAVKRP